MSIHVHVLSFDQYFHLYYNFNTHNDLILMSSKCTVKNFITSVTIGTSIFARNLKDLLTPPHTHNVTCYLKWVTFPLLQKVIYAVKLF